MIQARHHQQCQQRCSQPHLRRALGVPPPFQHAFSFKVSHDATQHLTILANVGLGSRRMYVNVAVNGAEWAFKIPFEGFKKSGFPAH
jgi:hypothetical protein